MTNLLTAITRLPYGIGDDLAKGLGGINRFRSSGELHAALAEVERRILTGAGNLLDMAARYGDEQSLEEAKHCMAIYDRIQTELKR